MAYVPPGEKHELRVYGQRLVVLLLAPGREELLGFGRAQGFCPWRTQLLARRPEFEDFLRACWNDEIEAPDLEPGLAVRLGASVPPKRCSDERIEELLCEVAANPAKPSSAQEIARRLGVKGSRARQILREQLGGSWQQLRRWERMCALSRRLADGQSLTRAAHALGFTDSSQLTRDFRATFGVAPGSLFRRARLVSYPPSPLGKDS